MKTKNEKQNNNGASRRKSEKNIIFFGFPSSGHGPAAGRVVPDTKILENFRIF